MTRHQRGTFLCAVVALGMLAAVIYHRLWSVDLHPFNTFLFSPGDRFGDLFNGWRYFAHHQRLADAAWPIAPGALTVVYLLLSLLPYPVALGVVIATLLLSVFAACWRGLRGEPARRTVAQATILTGLSYPVWFAFDRANLEVFVFAFSWAGIEAFRARRFWACAALLGLAIAFKPLPVVLLLVFLPERRWRETLLALGVAVALTVASRAYLLHFTSFEYATGGAAMASYFTHYVAGSAGLPYGHSAFGVIKVAVCKLSPSVVTPGRLAGDATIATLVFPYQVVTAVVGLGLAAWVWRARPALWRTVTVACCTISLLPVVSADYRLLNFFIPAMLFVRDARPTRRDALWLALFGLVLAPRAYDHYVFRRLCHVHSYEVTSAVVTSPILITVLLVLALTEPRSTEPAPATSPAPP